jgi:hypothetical protein
MSAISFSNNYVSSNYYASAKGQRVAATETEKINNNEVVSPAGDTLTISAEALEALNNSGDALTLSLEELEREEKVKIEKPKEIKQNITFQEYLSETIEHSNHRSLTDWAFSITSKSECDQTKTSIDRYMVPANCYKTQMELSYSRNQNCLENADEMFSELLKKNSINLNENERIELTIDYNGKVTVSGNISKEKSELIQNILDNNKSLGQNLLMAHTNRNYVDPSSPFGFYNDTKQIPLGIILQQEYGLSLSDFELNEDYKTRRELRLIGDDGSYYEPYELLKIKNGNESLIKELYDSERVLFCEIYQLLKEQKDNPDAELPRATFSYQNGVFVEKGKNDVAALKSFASKAVKVWEISGDIVDYSMTFNDKGEITDVTNIPRAYKSTLKDVILHYNRYSLDENTWDPNGRYFNAQVLQQYAFDKKRLTQYETGTNADDLDTFTIGKNEKGNFSIASNSKLLREITKSATENPTEKIVVRRFF